MNNTSSDQNEDSDPVVSSTRAVGFFSIVTAAAIIAVLIWGGSSIVTKVATRSTDEFTLAVLRTIASIPFALVVILLMRLKLPWRGRDSIDMLGVSVTGLIGFPVLFTLGVAYTTAGHAAVASAATPIFAGLMESAIQRRWPALSWWLGISVAFVGAVVLIWESVGIQSTGASWQGDLLVLGATFSAALSFQFGARLTPRFGAPAVTMWSIIVAGIILLPVFLLISTPAEILQITPVGWAAIAYLAAGASIVAYMAWFFALSRGGIARISVWQFAAPVVGIGAAAIFLDEPLTPMLLTATVVILLGVGLVQRRSRRTR